MPDINREHERALYAYQCVDSVVNNPSGDLKKKYRAAVLSSGALIHNAGLLQALTFYLSKRDEHYSLLAKHLLNRIVPDGAAGLEGLYNKLYTANVEEIAYYTMESKALVDWLKRFVERRIER